MGLVHLILWGSTLGSQGPPITNEQLQTIQIDFS
jgi:hypothetical protein